MQLRRIALLTLALPATAALAASSAQAHVQVASTNPAAGSTAKTSLRAVKVTFNGRLLGGTLTVRGPGGTVSIGRGGRDPRKTSRLTVSLKSGLKAGGYTATWAMTSSDGHGQRGSFRFTLRK